jgi:hypothetical protein
MVYLVQAEEREISFELLQQLAAVLARPPELSLADAAHRVQHAYGIFEMPDEAEAARVARGFAAAGFATITAPELFPPPPLEPLDLHHPELGGPVELAVAGELHLIREQDKWEYKVFAASPEGDFSVDPVRIDDDKLPHHAVQYYLDIFIAQRHWRVRTDLALALQEGLAKLDVSRARLGRGVRQLLEDGRQLPIFQKTGEYELYVAWLYQLLRLRTL